LPILSKDGSHLRQNGTLTRFRLTYMIALAQSNLYQSITGERNLNFRRYLMHLFVMTQRPVRSNNVQNIPDSSFYSKIYMYLSCVDPVQIDICSTKVTRHQYSLELRRRNTEISR